MNGLRERCDKHSLPFSDNGIQPLRFFKPLHPLESSAEIVAFQLSDDQHITVTFRRALLAVCRHCSPPLFSRDPLRSTAFLPLFPLLYGLSFCPAFDRWILNERNRPGRELLYLCEDCLAFRSFQHNAYPALRRNDQLLIPCPILPFDATQSNFRNGETQCQITIGRRSSRLWILPCRFSSWRLSVDSSSASRDRLLGPDLSPAPPSAHVNSI
jgi:hypothetical protein